jgi:hypothetical protein
LHLSRSPHCRYRSYFLCMNRTVNATVGVTLGMDKQPLR